MAVIKSLMIHWQLVNLLSLYVKYTYTPIFKYARTWGHEVMGTPGASYYLEIISMPQSFKL